MDLKEERNMILDMIAEGKITVEEAKQLLDALEQSAEDDTSEDSFDPQFFDTTFSDMRFPNVPHIISKATRKAYRKMQDRQLDMDSMMDGLENAREDLEDELQRMRDELNELHKEADRMRKEEKKD